MGPFADKLQAPTLANATRRRQATRSMAYVPNVAHDIFVSYAHLDNLSTGGRSRGGWIDSFIDPLTVQLKKRLGSGAVDIWMNRELPGNRPLTPEILSAVRDSALGSRTGPARG